jgi:nitroreductase
MDAIEAIMSRHAVRAFSGKTIPEDILAKILEAGRFAPSPLNSQPWHFIVVRDKPSLKELASHAVHGRFLQDADLDIVVTMDSDAKVDSWLAEHEQHVYSGACAIMDMWLAAWELGIGACWVSLDDKATRKTLSVPDDQKILGSLALGYPKGPLPHHAANERKPLSDVVFYERFGNQNH